MGVVSTIVNAAVVAAVGILIMWQLRGRFDAVERRFEAADRRVETLEARVDHRIDTLQSSIDALRSDVTQIALAVGARPRAGEA